MQPDQTNDTSGNFWPLFFIIGWVAFGAMQLHSIRLDLDAMALQISNRAGHGDADPKAPMRKPVIDQRAEPAPQGRRLHRKVPVRAISQPFKPMAMLPTTPTAHVGLAPAPLQLVSVFVIGLFHSHKTPDIKVIPPAKRSLSPNLVAVGIDNESTKPQCRRAFSAELPRQCISVLSPSNIRNYFVSFITTCLDAPSSAEMVVGPHDRQRGERKILHDLQLGAAFNNLSWRCANICNGEPNAARTSCGWGEQQCFADNQLRALRRNELGSREVDALSSELCLVACDQRKNKSEDTNKYRSGGGDGLGRNTFADMPEKDQKEVVRGAMIFTALICAVGIVYRELKNKHNTGGKNDRR